MIKLTWLILFVALFLFIQEAKAMETQKFICENEKWEVVDCFKWLNESDLNNAKNHLWYYLYDPKHTEGNYCIAKLSAKESHQGTWFVLELLRTKLNETTRCEITTKWYNRDWSYDWWPWQINSIHKEFWKNPKSKYIDYHLEIWTTWFIQWNCIKKAKTCKFYWIFNKKDHTKNLQKIFIKN